MENILNDFVSDVMDNYSLIKLENKLENLSLEIYGPNDDAVSIKKISDFAGKWLVLFFYPADFTFVCPTELKDLNSKLEEIKALGNVELFVVSTDTVFSHKRWVETELLLKNFQIPMISDRNTILSRYFGILNENSGNSERGTFIISPNGILKSIEIITEPVGRSSKELIRKIRALKFVSENQGQVCPASWDLDMPVLNPSIKIAGNIGNQPGFGKDDEMEY